MDIKLVKPGIWQAIEKTPKQDTTKMKPEKVDAGILNWLKTK